MRLGHLPDYSKVIETVTLARNQRRLEVRRAKVL